MAKNTHAAKPKRKSRKKIIVLIVLLVITGLFVGAGYAAQRIMQEPSQGTVITTLPAVTQPVQVELKQFDAKHLSFALPITYLEQAKKPDANTNNFESHTFIATSMVSKVLNVVVSKLPAGGLDDDPSYAMRMQNPDKYQMRPIVLKNEKVVLATVIDSPEFQQTAFWAHADKLLTITLSGVSNNEQETAEEHKRIVESVTWR